MNSGMGDLTPIRPLGRYFWWVVAEIVLLSQIEMASLLVVHPVWAADPPHGYEMGIDMTSVEGHSCCRRLSAR